MKNFSKGQVDAVQGDAEPPTSPKQLVQAPERARTSWCGCDENRCQHQNITWLSFWRYEEPSDCQKDNTRNPFLSCPRPVRIHWPTDVSPLPTPSFHCLFTLASLPCSSFPKNVCSDFLPAREAGEGFYSHRAAAVHLNHAGVASVRARPSPPASCRGGGARPGGAAGGLGLAPSTRRRQQPKAQVCSCISLSLLLSLAASDEQLSVGASARPSPLLSERCACCQEPNLLWGCGAWKL